MAIGTGAAILGSAALSAGVSALSASKSSKAAKSAAETQAASADRAAELQAQSTRDQLALTEKLYNQSRADVAPWRASGLRALGTLERMQSGTLPVQTTPGYNFVRNEGLKAIGSGMGARGLANSGARTKAALRYGTGLASQEYGNEYNRVANMAGVGQSASNTLAGLSSGYGTNASGIMQSGTGAVNNANMQGANARASGYVGSANAWGQGLSGIANAAGTGLGYLALTGMGGNSAGAGTGNLFNPLYTGVS